MAKVTIEVKEMEGAPAYVCTMGDVVMWTWASHLVENPNPKAVFQSWADEYECAHGENISDQVFKAVAGLKVTPHLDDVTRQQLRGVSDG